MTVRKTPPDRDLERELRYMSAQNVVKDHASPQAKAAIAAVMEWMSFNTYVAWEIGKHRHYTTSAFAGRKLRDMSKISALVMDNARYEAARKILVPEKARRKKR